MNKTEKVNSFSDLRSYSRHWVKEFIDEYKVQECLWQTKHPDYNNHILRNQAYDKLVDKLKEVETNPDRAMVVRKINSLRSAFRREYRKKCSKSDYEPRLWYYNSLAFIADQQFSSKRIIGIGRNANIYNETIKNHHNNRLHEKEKKRLFSENFDEDEDEDEMNENQEHEHHEEEEEEEETAINPYDDNADEINIKEEHAKIIELNNVEDDEQMITIHHSNHPNTVQIHHEQRVEQSNEPQFTIQNIQNIQNTQQREHETQQAVNSITTQQHQAVPVHTIQIQTREQFETSHHEKDHQLKVMNLYKPDCIPLYNTPMTTSMVKHDDEYDAVGVNVASKLRAMTQHQRIIAEKLIGDVLFSGQLESLTVSSKLSI